MNAMPPPGSRVAFYARYSTKHQDYRSIEGQFGLCQDYADARSWIVTGKFSDAARTGTTVVGRSGLFELLAAAERGEFDVLLVEDIDRVSRDTADTHGIDKALKELDIVLCTVTGGPVTELEVAFKAIQNAQYVKQNVEKTRRGQLHTVRSGRISGSVSYGYQKVLEFKDGKPVNGLREVHPEHAEIVRRIFRGYDAGVSTIEICRRLNADGIPSPRGKTWGPGVLTGSAGATQGILRNRLYIGEFVWRRTKSRKRNGKTKLVPTALEERIFEPHPELVIIETDLFERVQERIRKGGEGRYHEYRHPTFLFSGMYECGCCGEGMVVINKRLGCYGRSRKGICDNSRRVPREGVEDAVLKKITTYVVGSESLDEALAEYRAEAAAATAAYLDRSERAKVELKEVHKRSANLLRKLGDDDDDYVGAAIKGELQKLAVQRKQLEHQIASKPQVLGRELEPEVVRERVRSRLGHLRTALETDDQEAARAREIIRGLVDKIVISPDLSSSVDGRGAGAVTVTVYGRVAELLGIADLRLDRCTQQGSRTETLLDGTIATYWLTFNLPYLNPRLHQRYADLPILARLLDEATFPVRHAAMLKALKSEGQVVFDGDTKDAAARLRYALQYLRAQGHAHPVSAGPKSGWVWDHIPVEEAEWHRRAVAASTEPLPDWEKRDMFPDPTAVVWGRTRLTSEIADFVKGATRS